MGLTHGLGFLKRKIKLYCEDLDKKHRARKKVITKRALETLKVRDDSEDAIRAKLKAIETLKGERPKTVQNIKAASEFNRIRDSEHSNKLFLLTLRLE